MLKLSKVQKAKRLQERQERRGLLERRRKRKFDHLKNTGQLAHYYSEKTKVERDEASARRKKRIAEYRPKIIGAEKLTLWKRIKNFFSIKH